MNRRLYEPRFGLDVLKKRRISLLTGIRNPDRPNRSIVIIAISTSRIMN